MVQQVTGVRFGNSEVVQAVSPPVLKPEPQRLGARFPVCGGGGGGVGLPTLDTSAFLINHHHQQQQQNSGSGSEVSGPGAVSFGSGYGLPDNNGAIGSGFDTFSSFPTLESWKAVM